MGDTPSSQSSSRLDGMDEPILELLDVEPMMGVNIAERLGVNGKAIGSRLMSLRKRGYVVSYVPENATTLKMWRRTQKAWRDG